MERRELVLELAREAGFDLAGAGPARPAAGGPLASKTWLEAGLVTRALSYLERFRDRIVDPRPHPPGGPQRCSSSALAHARPGALVGRRAPASPATPAVGTTTT